jgi:hypothetical protein
VTGVEGRRWPPVDRPFPDRYAISSARAIFPLPEASEALTALLSRRYAGKVVLET